MSQYHPLPEHCADTVPIKVNRVFDSAVTGTVSPTFRSSWTGENCRQMSLW